MNKEQLESLLPQLIDYFDNVTTEQLLKDIDDVGCSHMIEEIQEVPMNRLESIKEKILDTKIARQMLKLDEYDEIIDDFEYLIQRLERYEKALNFYGDEQNYDKWTYGVERVTNVTRDKGNVAKEALKE